MISKLIEFYKKNRMIIAYSVMALVLASPYINLLRPQLELPIKILSFVPIFLLFLLNDWRTETDNRLKDIERRLSDPNPPTFKNFAEVAEPLRDLIKKRIMGGKSVSIKVISVSAKYSWPFLKTIVLDILNNPPSNKDTKLSINIGVTTPQKLEEWDLTDWKLDCKSQIATFKNMVEVHKNGLSNNRIELNMFGYDNLPHWHGVMVDDEILFLGRTEWSVVFLYS